MRLELAGGASTSGMIATAIATILQGDTDMSTPTTSGTGAPNPGSRTASEMGCTCPTIDNRHGLGAYNGKPGQFWINERCPLHGKKGKADDHTYD